MTKVVYNSCYGGFSLSEKGIRRYAEIKGMTLYPEKTEFGSTTWWTKPPTEPRVYGDDTFYDRDLERDDPVLVQVVEELGSEADGGCAALDIEDVPSGMQYRIDEYDGNERVMTREDYDWKVA